MTKRIPNLKQLFSQALNFHQNGKFENAIDLYRQILNYDINHADSIHYLGIALYQQNKKETGLKYIEESIQINPESPQYYINYGLFILQEKQFDKAYEIFNKAYSINKTIPEIHFNLGVVSCKLSKNNEAIIHFKNALNIKPDYAEALTNLGSTYLTTGNIKESIISLKQSMKIKPDLAQTYNTLGNAYKTKGNNNKAIDNYKKAIYYKPDYYEAYNNLSHMYLTNGDNKEAQYYCNKALEIKSDYPHGHLNAGVLQLRFRNYSKSEYHLKKAVSLKDNFAEAYFNLGVLYYNQDKHDLSFDAYKKAIAINPSYKDAYINTAKIMYDKDMYEQAAKLYVEVLKLNPKCQVALSNIAGIFLKQGDIKSSIYYYKKALSIKPDMAALHSNYLFCINYDHEISSEKLFIEHIEYGKIHNKLTENNIKYYNNFVSNKRLKVGYVSSDFSDHPVAYFIEPVLKNHNKSIIEPICYSNVSKPDNITNIIKSHCSKFIDIYGINSEKVSNIIRNDNIDILVDLAGHTRGNSLTVFAHKPAPIQISYLGYPNTTGLKAIDYRLVDNITDPDQDELYTEKLIRFQNCFLCFSPCYKYPDIKPLPCLNNGYITFGSFNNISKINIEVIRVWSEILKRTTNSKILLKSKAFNDSQIRKRYENFFKKFNINKERIILKGSIISPYEHLNYYNNLDIALDTFPYNGTTTTCEALWMSVPVITIKGNRHASRVGTSLLTYSGFKELIAYDIEDYIKMAVNISTNMEKLIFYRNNIRNKMLSSKLCNAEDFTNEIELIYQSIWKNLVSSIY